MWSILFFVLSSSILAFVGMIVGRFLGDLPNLTPWIFMATAGVFLYVALVDMIPELNSGHSHPYTSEEHHESKATELCLQVSLKWLFILSCNINVLALSWRTFKDLFKDSSREERKTHGQYYWEGLNSWVTVVIK